jgi:hypothetical protein
MSRKLSECPEPRDAPANRRRESRKLAAGTGWMEPLDGMGREELRLVDTSPSGFRACHRCPALSAGDRVRFHHARAEGVAVSIWNRVTGDHVESGFLIVSGGK